MTEPVPLARIEASNERGLRQPACPRVDFKPAIRVQIPFGLQRAIGMAKRYGYGEMDGIGMTSDPD